jgi:hypothetical protein
MKNHHDRVSQRDSKQRDKTDHRAHRQGAAKKNKNCAPTNQLALPVLLFTLELNQKDHKLCAAATVEQHLKRGASLSGVADRLVAFEEFGVGGVGQLNPPRRSRINPA